MNSMAWTADGSRLAVAGAGDPADSGTEKSMGHVYVFDVDRQTQLLKVRLGQHRLHAYFWAWHPQGELLAGGNADGLVIVWEVGTGRPVISAQMHISTVRALDWTPDGRRIASVSDDGTLKIWDSVTGDELLSLTDRARPLTAVKWSSDGKQLAAGDEAGRIRVWDASVGYELFSGLGQSRVRSRIHKERGLRCIEHEDLAEAVVQFSEAIKWAPSRTSYWQLRGSTYLRLGRSEEALNDLTAAVDLDPGDADVLHSRVAVYAARGQWKSALPESSRLVELKQDGNPRFSLAMIHLMLGQLDAYRHICREMFEGDHEDMIARRALRGGWTCAIVPKSLPDLQGILPLVREAISRLDGTPDGNHPKDLLSLGALLYRAGKAEEAIQPLTKAGRALEQSGYTNTHDGPLPGDVGYFLAMAHHDLGHYQEARTWFDKAEVYSKTTLATPFPQPGFLRWDHRVALEHLQREARTMFSTADPKPK